MSLASLDEQAAQQFTRDFELLFNAGDAAGMAAFYAEDAKLLAEGTELIRGRGAIEEFWRHAIDRARAAAAKRGRARRPPRQCLLLVHPARSVGCSTRPMGWIVGGRAQALTPRTAATQDQAGYSRLMGIPAQSVLPPCLLPVQQGRFISVFGLSSAPRHRGTRAIFRTPQHSLLRMLSPAQLRTPSLFVLCSTAQPRGTARTLTRRITSTSPAAAGL